MKPHTKKLIAPIVVALIISAYMLFFMIGFLFTEGVPIAAKLFGALIPSAILGVTIFVLVERIKEIKGGEEDDLSKY